MGDNHWTFRRKERMKMLDALRGYRQEGTGQRNLQANEAIAREKVLTNVGVSGERKASWDD